MRFLFPFFLIIIFISCNENVQPNEGIITNNPWLQTFTPYIYNFKGIKLNIDTGQVLFEFKTSLTIKEYFNKVDSSALSNNWTLKDSSEFTRVYSKKIYMFEADTSNTFVKLVVDKENLKILLESK